MSSRNRLIDFPDSWVRPQGYWMRHTRPSAFSVVTSSFNNCQFNRRARLHTSQQHVDQFQAPWRLACCELQG
jgi:hypothetical protein